VSAWRLICKFSLLLGHRLQNHPANEKQGPAPEEMSPNLLTNKKQGKNDKVHAAHFIKPTCSSFARRNMFISMENRRIPLKI
jgi:hypothetical protein